jgi:hypothetical protein
VLLANPNPENIIPMTAQQARECADAIKGNLESLRFMLLDLQRRRGWEALGYSTWRECAQAEFGQSQGYIYKLLHAAEVEENLAQSGFIQLDKTEHIPVSQLEELHKLPPDQQAAGLHRADQIAVIEGRERTAIHVAKAVKEINGGNSSISDAPDQDDEALKHFEAIASKTRPIDTMPTASTATVTKPTPELLAFHCLLSQQQRERLFQAIVVAKNQRGLRTTAEALDAIAQGAVPKAIAQEYLNAHQ